MRKALYLNWLQRIGQRSARSAVLAMAFAATLAGCPSLAADKTTVVKFTPGTTSATLVDKVKGYDSNIFLLGANAGQTLSVVFKPNNTSCYYNVTGPSGGDALFNGSMSSEDFSGTLAQSGDHQVLVYLMRNDARRGKTCRFTITFRIEN